MMWRESTSGQNIFLQKNCSTSTETKPVKKDWVNETDSASRRTYLCKENAKWSIVRFVLKVISMIIFLIATTCDKWILPKEKRGETMLYICQCFHRNDKYEVWVKSKNPFSLLELLRASTLSVVLKAGWEDILFFLRQVKKVHLIYVS